MEQKFVINSIKNKNPNLMPIINLFSILSIFFLVTIKANAESTSLGYFELLPNQDTYRLGHKTKFYEDKSNLLTIQDVSNPVFGNKFSNPQPKEFYNFGRTNSSYWVQIPIVNHSQISDWWFVLSNPSLESVELYLVESVISIPKVLNTQKIDSSFPINSRKIPVRDFIFPLKIMQNQSFILYLKVTSINPMQIVPSVTTPVSYIVLNQNWSMASAIYFGMILIMIFYNLFLAFSLKEEAYFFYVFYITCMGLLIAQHNGLNYEYLWQHFPVWNQLAATILGSLTNLAALMFTIRFLNTKNDLPRAHKLLNGLCILITIIIILSLFESKIVNYVYQIIPTLSVLSILMIAFLRLKQNYKPAKYFLLAWTSLSLGVLSAILTNIELIPYNNLTVWSFQIGTIVEILFLALALSDRIKRSNIEKNDAILQKLDASMKLNALTNIFEKFVPYQFLQCLEKNDLAQIKLGDSAEQDMTVLFLDIRDFTSLSETLGPQKNFEFINEFISHLGPVIHNNHGFIDKFTGDGFMALFPINADNAVQASKEMIYGDKTFKAIFKGGRRV